MRATIVFAGLLILAVAPAVAQEISALEDATPKSNPLFEPVSKADLAEVDALIKACKSDPNTCKNDAPMLGEIE